ncbi:MAG: cell division ATP-binding protein FtsE [Gammaproteobacteria bacterium]|nr:cell division ATP-binding protein FtsE [Gammaproteobacteria bacterium]
MIRCSGVTKSFAAGRDAIRDLDLEIDAGEFVFLTGHSGAGKSTLLRMVAILERPTRGQLVVDGRNVERIARGQIPYFRRQIGFIFQDHRLLMDRSVFDNVALPLTVAGHRAQEIQKRVRAALDKVGLLALERKPPELLSSGEQQRVGVARAVVNRPRILLADEPTGNLDPSLSFEIMKLFEQFNQVGVTVLIATHDVDLVDAMQKRTVELDGGRLTDDRTPGQ